MPDAEGILEAREIEDMPPEKSQLRRGEKSFARTWIKGADNLDWGMKNRLSRLIGTDGHCQFLPIDHGYFQGPTRCLERPAETIQTLAPYADGLFVTRGVLRAAIDFRIDTPIILRVSGGTSVVGEDLANEIITTSIEDMLRLNVSAVGVSIFVGSDYEQETLENLALSCRIAAELGARIVKTYYCDDGFEKVTMGCPVPVVIAGGPKCETALEVFEFVYDGLQKGAIGINLGRNVWQHPHPLAVMKALNAVIHGGATPEQALDLFETTRREKS